MLGLLAWFSTFTQADATTCLINFGQRQCGAFVIQPNVIVRSDLDKSHLQVALGRPVRQLAFLDPGGLYLLGADDSEAEAARLATEPFILYAQPDVAQERIRHARSAGVGLSTAGVPAQWAGTGGRGVRIAIIDDGFDLDHEDLRGLEVGFGYDADNKSLDATPKEALDRHGTRVAGIIFARHNGLGIDGVAPDATLIPIRQVGTRTSDTVLSFTVAALAGADIINCSWNSPVLMEPVRDVIRHLAKHGRGGLGIPIFFAAGNEGESLRPGTREAAMDEVIAVGALNRGNIATYSNRGELVDLWLPGSLPTTTPKGYGRFTGTSASSALAAGLAALLLAQSPGLTLTEVKASLATAATSIRAQRIAKPGQI